MSNKMKKAMIIAVAGTIGLGAVSTTAADFTKTVKAVYNNIRVKVDGQYKATTKEPFIIDESVYVSLRDIGQLLGDQVSWDGANQTVEITTAKAPIDGSQAELAKKNLEIATLTSENAQLKAKLAQYEESDDTEDKDDEDKDTDKETDLDDIVEMIEDDYEDKYDVAWDFELKKSGSRLRLDINFDSDDDGDDFEDISDTQLSNFVEDILDDIQDEYYEDIEIYGYVYDEEERESVADFKITERGTFSIDIEERRDYDQDDLDEFAEVLEDRHDDFPRINLSDYDTASISVRSIELKEDDGEIEYYVTINYASSDRLHSAWERMDSYSEGRIEDFMQDIWDDIEDEYDTDNITGYIKNIADETIGIHEEDDFDIK